MLQRVKRLILRFAPGHDDMIDTLISRNRAAYRDDMSTPDHAVIHRIGKRRWREITNGQRRIREAE